MTPASRAEAIRIFRENGGILRTHRALELGMHPRMLYGLRDDGIVERVTDGVYRLSSLGPLPEPDLVAVALRVPRAVVCLVSALAWHDATTEIPHEVQIALPRGSKPPRLSHPPIRSFQFSGPAFDLGVLTATVGGVEIRVYELAKTVVDCFRFRNKLGTDVAIEALQLATTRHGTTPAELLRYARPLRMARVMRPYLEAMG